MKNILTIENQGVTFKVDISESDKFWKSIAAGNWEPESFKIFKQYIKADDLILDVGCWEGPFSLYAAALGANVIGIDPDITAIRRMQRHVVVNEILASRIKVFNIAIAAKNGEMKLYARNFFGDSASSLLSRTLDSKKNVTVPTKTFADFLLSNQIQKVDFIKMDIEGSEFFILPNILETLKSLQFPTLYIAFHTQYLDEYLMKKTIPIKLLAKIFIKFSRFLKFVYFRRSIQKRYANIFNQLMPYYRFLDTDYKEVSWQNWAKNMPNESLIFEKNTP